MTIRRTVSHRQRIRNRLVILLNRAGLPVGPMHLLTVPGRKSGLPRTTPVAPVTVNGGCYLIQAYPNSDWVKNARAAGSFASAAGSCPVFHAIPAPDGWRRTRLSD